MCDEDDKPAIIVDNGSGMMKAGCSGVAHASTTTTTACTTTPHLLLPSASLHSTNHTTAH